MEITQALVQRFLDNNCSPEEADAVVKYLSSNKNALDYYLSKREWDAINSFANLDENVSLEMLVQIRQQLFNRPKVKVVSIYNKLTLRITVAAALIIFLVGAWWLVKPANSNLNTAVVAKQQEPVAPLNNLLANDWQIRKNNSAKPITITLEDGSTIILYNHSVVKFQQPFIGNTRKIILDGDAFFEVAKNKFKPFVVYSGNLSTTALGTSFRVTAFKGGQTDIKVKLFTGKVVVKSIKMLINWKKDIFLLPGEEMVFDALTQDAEVTNFRNKKAVTNNNPATLSSMVASNELKFNNTSLPKVMEELSTLYNIKIDFVNADIEKMNFTGTIDKSDKVQAILKVIAQMNGLEVVQTSNGFNIGKPQKP